MDEKLIARIRALREKTVERGCTEAEALAAAAKVAELLDRHELTLSEVERRAAPCGEWVLEVGKKQRQPIAAVAWAIAEFCDCKLWQQKQPGGRTAFVFFGLPGGLEMARSVHALVTAALHTEWQRHAAGRRFIRHGDDEKGAFLLGLAGSLAERLLAMRAERNRALQAAGGGRALVVQRHAVVEAEFGRLGLELRQGGRSGKRVSAAAYDAGQAAGEALDLGKLPVSRR